MTPSTEPSRSARSAPRGTSKGMRASAIAFLARTMRWPIVVSAARKARAISAVVSPPRRRSVRATRDSAGRMGWQAVKIRRRRSSPTSSSSRSIRSVSVSGLFSSSVRPTSSSLAWAMVRWRKWSMARRLAVCISQAPGFCGTPPCGQVLRAISSASWASSSAKEMSRTMRARPATRRACSIFQTLVMARWVSEGALIGTAQQGRDEMKTPRDMCHTGSCRWANVWRDQATFSL